MSIVYDGDRETVQCTMEGHGEYFEEVLYCGGTLTKVAELLIRYKGGDISLQKAHYVLQSLIRGGDV